MEREINIDYGRAMMKSYDIRKLGGLMMLCLLTILMVGCSKTEISCPAQAPADLSRVLEYADDDQFPFRFPLDELGEKVYPDPAIICTYASYKAEYKFHAAEDYYLPSGTPVYAIADGLISYSGPRRGYGWLIIIDHAQADIYSLYGHLSPSRWKLEPGPVEKGDLIAYLGDPDENGGSPEEPLPPHLHFGIRVGQRNDYPGMGEWRWQAGWIKPCPMDLGWMNPSLVITSQDIHIGDLYKPTTGFLAKWWIDILFSSIFIFYGIGMFIIAERQKKPIIIVAPGIVYLVALWVFNDSGVILNNVLIAMATLSITVGVYKLIRQNTKKSKVQA